MKIKNLFFLLMALCLSFTIIISCGDDDDDNDSSDDDDTAADDDDNDDNNDTDDDDNNDASDDDDNDTADDDDSVDDDDTADDDDNDDEVDVLGDSIVFEVAGKIYSPLAEEVEPGDGSIKVRWGKDIYAMHATYVIQDPENERIHIEAGKGTSGSSIKIITFEIPYAHAALNGEYTFDLEDYRLGTLMNLTYKQVGYEIEITGQDLWAVCAPGGRYKVTKANFEVGKEFKMEGECTLIEPTEEFEEEFLAEE